MATKNPKRHKNDATPAFRGHLLCLRTNGNLTSIESSLLFSGGHCGLMGSCSPPSLPMMEGAPSGSLYAKDGDALAGRFFRSIAMAETNAGEFQLATGVLSPLVSACSAAAVAGSCIGSAFLG